MRVLLVDDEPLALRRLEILLSRRPWVDVVAAVRDGQAAIRAARELNPDVVFLDIQMPQLDGFEVAALLSEGNRPEIIFVTAYETHAVRAFEAAAIDYLLKPVEMERLDEALGRVRTHLASRDANARADELEALVHTLRGHDGDRHPDLWIRDRRGRVRLEKTRIDWVEAEGDYVRIHSGARSWLMRGDHGVDGKNGSMITSLPGCTGRRSSICAVSRGLRPHRPAARRCVWKTERKSGWAGRLNPGSMNCWRGRCPDGRIGRLGAGCQT